MIEQIPRIIVALDFASEASALTLADTLDPARCSVKVGKELFTRYGPAIVKQLQHRGYRVFLDLKFHDIPHTVAKACSAAADLGVWMLTVHASGGRAMLAAAQRALTGPSQPLLVAVTVLTSLSKQDLQEIGIHAEPSQQVKTLAQLVYEVGLAGVVCSAQEAALLRKTFNKNFVLVTPGIRMAQTATTEDQKRIATPQVACLAGANYLVIGRPITQARDPLSVLSQIEKDILKAL